MHDQAAAFCRTVHANEWVNARGEQRRIRTGGRFCPPVHAPTRRASRRHACPPDAAIRARLRTKIGEIGEKEKKKKKHRKTEKQGKRPPSAGADARNHVGASAELTQDQPTQNTEPGQMRGRSPLWV